MNHRVPDQLRGKGRTAPRRPARDGQSSTTEASEDRRYGQAAVEPRHGHRERVDRSSNLIAGRHRPVHPGPQRGPAEIAGDRRAFPSARHPGLRPADFAAAIRKQYQDDQFAPKAAQALHRLTSSSRTPPHCSSRTTTGPATAARRTTSLPDSQSPHAPGRRGLPNLRTRRAIAASAPCWTGSRPRSYPANGARDA